MTEEDTQMLADAIPSPLAVRKTDTAEVRAYRNVWKGRSVIDIRIWYLPDGGAEFVPTRKGLTIDDAKLPKLINLLTELV